MLADGAGELHHVDRLFGAQDFGKFCVGHNQTFIFLVLQLVFLDVLPDFFGHIAAGRDFRTDDVFEFIGYEIFDRVFLHIELQRQEPFRFLAADPLREKSEKGIPIFQMQNCIHCEATANPEVDMLRSKVCIYRFLILL